MQANATGSQKATTQPQATTQRDSEVTKTPTNAVYKNAGLSDRIRSDPQAP